MTSIQAKTDLADDRPILLVGKSISRFNQGTAAADALESIRLVNEALDNYELRELTLWENQYSSVLEDLKKISDELREFRNIVDAPLEQFVQYRDKVRTAHQGKLSRLEFEAVAGEINKTDSRDVCQSMIKDLEETIESLLLRSEHHLRVMEYRQQQMEPIIFWANVLRSGSLPS